MRIAKIWLGLLFATAILAACVAPELTPSVWPTATPQQWLPVTDWAALGSVVNGDEHGNCLPNLGASLAVGRNPHYCGYGEGTAQLRVQVPPAAGLQVVSVELACARDLPCLQVPAWYDGIPADIYLDNRLTPLWQLRCDPANGCGPASSKPLTLSFVSEGGSEHVISIQTRGGAVWYLSGAKVRIQPLPSLVRGIAYSPYRDCQIPGEGRQPGPDDIRQDIEIIREMGNAIRTYSSTGVSNQIATLASAAGLRVSAGAWLGKDLDENEAEIKALIELSHRVELESVIVGNEVMLRGDLSEDELLAYIERVKAAVDVPVTTADISGILLQHPRIMEAVDYELVHIYAYWDGIPIEDAARYVAETYRDFQQQAGGRRVVIGETGWPSAGPTRGLSVASPAHQRRFAREFIHIAQQENIEYYYFDAFDEQWKTEGGVGPYWGLLYSDRTFKYDIQSLFAAASDAEPQPASGHGAPVAVTQEASPAAISAPVFPVYTNFADETNHYSPDGWMGDYQRIQMDTCHSADPKWRETSIEVQYAPDPDDEMGWAGVFWLYPPNNWGNLPLEGTDLDTYDLSRYTQLTFRARAQFETQVKFFVGGVSTGEDGTPLPYPSSLGESRYAVEADPLDGFVNLDTEWQDFHIDLRGADLHRVIDGFGWAVERARSPLGSYFYLDDIIFETDAPPPVIPPIHIYSGETIRSGLNLGLDTSGRQRDWLFNLHGEMKANYPAGQDWGVVYINVGQPAPLGQRNSLDLSQYKRMSFELRGETGREQVWVGIKDAFQRDDGTEKKILFLPSREWQAYEIDLNWFWASDFEMIYLPIEFVFSGPEPQTIYFRNIRYLP